MRAVNTQVVPSAPNSHHLVESIRVATFDQANLISMALDQVHENVERTESLLKSIERLNRDLFGFYQALHALTGKKDGAA